MNKEQFISKMEKIQREEELISKIEECKRDVFNHDISKQLAQRRLDFYKAKLSASVDAGHWVKNEGDN